MFIVNFDCTNNTKIYRQIAKQEDFKESMKNYSTQIQEARKKYHIYVNHTKDCIIGLTNDAKSCAALSTYGKSIDETNKSKKQALTKLLSFDKFFTSLYEDKYFNIVNNCTNLIKDSNSLPKLSSIIKHLKSYSKISHHMAFHNSTGEKSIIIHSIVNTKYKILKKIKRILLSVSFLKDQLPISNDMVTLSILYTINNSFIPKSDGLKILNGNSKFLDIIKNTYETLLLSDDNPTKYIKELQEKDIDKLLAEHNEINSTILTMELYMQILEILKINLN